MFLKYEIVTVCGPDHAARRKLTAADLADQVWLLGPAATEPGSVVARLIAELGVPDQNQRIFQSHAAAVQEAKRDNGLTFGVAFSVAEDVDRGSLVQVSGPRTQPTAPGAR